MLAGVVFLSLYILIWALYKFGQALVDQGRRSRDAEILFLAQESEVRRLQIIALEGSNDELNRKMGEAQTEAELSKREQALEIAHLGEELRAMEDEFTSSRHRTMVLNQSALTDQTLETVRLREELTNKISECEMKSWVMVQAERTLIEQTEEIAWLKEELVRLEGQCTAKDREVRKAVQATKTLGETCRSKNPRIEELEKKCILQEHEIARLRARFSSLNRMMEENESKMRNIVGYEQKIAELNDRLAECYGLLAAGCSSSSADSFDHGGLPWSPRVTSPPQGHPRRPVTLPAPGSPDTHRYYWDLCG